MDLAYTALFTVLLAVCAWITVPLTVPFTLQTFGVFAALGVLGGRRGTYAVAAYLLLGLAGLLVMLGIYNRRYTRADRIAKNAEKAAEKAAGKK